MTIILTTMVRNEEKALPRLLRSCAGTVTHVALNDTGSSDNTVAVAKAICAELGLDLSIDHNHWEDFGTNRTWNLEHGRRVAERIGGVHHMLLLDADMALPSGCTFPADLPPAVMLTQREGTREWKNLRMLATDVSARYIGRTHEYVSTGCPLETLHSPVLLDYGDGGCKSDKFERDERLLRLDLADNPNNTRVLFYLANTLRTLGRVNEAKELYDRRARFCDFPEESYVSRLEASRCSTGYEADARAWEAYGSRPHRIEALAEMAKRATDAGKHQYALMIANLGKHVPYPTGETLFTSRDPYLWDFPYVEMISSYYAGDLDRGMLACEKLQLTKGSPHARLALDNTPYYARQLPGVRRELPITPMEWFVPANPCIRKTEEGWMAIVRRVNYRIDANGAYTHLRGAEYVTRNVVHWYDEAFQPTTRAPQELYGPAPTNPECSVLGMEDLRIVSVTGDILVTAGPRLDASPTRQPEMWESTWDLSTGTWLSGRKISDGDRVEKNWLPLDGGYLYGHGTDKIVFVDADGKFVRSVNCKHNLSHLRGSAAPIPYSGGFLYMTHEVALRNGRRVYLHRFVFAPSDAWTDLKISLPFRFSATPCIECCFAIANTPGGLVLACSYEDCEVYLLTVDHKTIADLLSVTRPD